MELGNKTKNALAFVGAFAVVGLLMAAATGITTNQTRTAAPIFVNLTPSAVAEGTSLSHARADHNHSLSGVLTYDYGGTGVSTAGDDTVLVGDGAAWVAETIVASATDGYALSWDQTTNAFSASGPFSGTGTPTACTNQFVTGFTLNAEAVPTSTCTTDTLASAQHANQGTTTTVLHGNAAGNPSWAAVADADLANNYSGVGSCTNQFVTATVDNAGPTCTTATLASAQFANQGTTTTVLHGNAAGNPSWAAVSLTADVSGILSSNNGGTGTITETADSVLVGTGTAWAARTMTDSNGIGQALRYDVTTDAFSTGTFIDSSNTQASLSGAKTTSGAWTFNGATTTTAAITTNGWINLGTTAATTESLGRLGRRNSIPTWAVLSGTAAPSCTIAASRSYNVTSCTRNAVGRYRINITNSLGSGNYASTCAAYAAAGGDRCCNFCVGGQAATTIEVCRFVCSTGAMEDGEVQVVAVGP